MTRTSGDSVAYSNLRKVEARAISATLPYVPRDFLARVRLLVNRSAEGDWIENQDHGAYLRLAGGIQST